MVAVSFDCMSQAAFSRPRQAMPLNLAAANALFLAERSRQSRVRQIKGEPRRSKTWVG